MICTECLQQSQTTGEKPKCPRSPKDRQLGGKESSFLQETWADVDNNRPWKRHKIDSRHSIESATDRDKVEEWLQIDDEGCVARVSKGGMSVFKKLHPDRRTRDVYVALVTSGNTNIDHVPAELRDDVDFFVDVLGKNPDVAVEGVIPPDSMMTPDFFHTLLSKYPSTVEFVDKHADLVDVWCMIFDANPERMCDYVKPRESSFRYQQNPETHKRTHQWLQLIAKRPNLLDKLSRCSALVDEEFCLAVVSANPRVVNIVAATGARCRYNNDITMWYADAVEHNRDVLPFIDDTISMESLYSICVGRRIVRIADVPADMRTDDVIVAATRAQGKIPYEYIPDHLRTPKLYARCVDNIRLDKLRADAIATMPAKYMLSEEMYDVARKTYYEFGALRTVFVKLIDYCNDLQRQIDDK